MRTAYCLPKWKAWAENVHELDERTKKNAQVLFMALKELPKEDVTFLAEKYVQGVQGCLYDQEFKGANSYKPRSDSVMANLSGLSQAEYTRKRRRIEQALHQHLKHARIALENSQTKQLSQFYLKAGGLYIHKFEFGKYGKLQEPIQCTTKKELAYLFDAGSEITKEFERILELKRIDPNNDESIDKAVWVDVFTSDSKALFIN